MFGIFKKKDPLADLQLPNEDFFNKGFGKDNQGSMDQSSSTDSLNSMGMPMNDFSPPAINDSSSGNFNFNNSSNTNSGANNNNFNQNYGSNISPLQGPTALSSAQTASVQYATPQTPHAQGTAHDFNVRERELELISSKLDVLRALLENLAQRMNTIEQKLEMDKRKNW